MKPEIVNIVIHNGRFWVERVVERKMLEDAPVSGAMVQAMLRDLDNGRGIKSLVGDVDEA